MLWQLNTSGPQRGPWGAPPSGERHSAQQGNGQQNPWARREQNGGGGPRRPVRTGSGPHLPKNPFSLIAFALLGLAVVWLGFSMIYQIQPGQVGIVRQFGQFNREVSSGLNFKLPAPFETVSVVDISRIRSTQIGFELTRAEQRRPIRSESQMITGDQNIIEIEATIQWRVENPKDYLFNIRDPEQTVKIAAESAIREIVGRTTIQEALSIGRDKIQIATRALLQDVLTQYQSGITINEVLLQNIQPPKEVKAAFDDVQSAEQDRDTSKNQAERYANEVIPNARGEAEKIRNQAQTYYEQITNDAQGRAQRFLEVSAAYENNPSLTEQRLRIEIVRDILKKRGNIIIDSNVGSAPLPYLPLPGLNQR